MLDLPARPCSAPKRSGQTPRAPHHAPHPLQPTVVPCYHLTESNLLHAFVIPGKGHPVIKPQHTAFVVVFTIPRNAFERVSFTILDISRHIYCHTRTSSAIYPGIIYDLHIWRDTHTLDFLFFGREAAIQAWKAGPWTYPRGKVDSKHVQQHRRQRRHHHHHRQRHRRQQWGSDARREGLRPPGPIVALVQVQTRGGCGSNNRRRRPRRRGRRGPTDQVEHGRAERSSDARSARYVVCLFISRLLHSPFFASHPARAVLSAVPQSANNH